MTLNEFRAWFDGFSEAIGDAPTPEQWERIKLKVNEHREGGEGTWTLPFPVRTIPTPQPVVAPQPYVSPSIPAWPGPRLGEVTCIIPDAPSASTARN